MDDCESLSHTKWECKCPVMFIPESRRRTLYGQRGPHWGAVFRKLTAQIECII